ncbi:chromate efflux transporter [Peptoniphilaceae bacterium SGI.131]
MKNTKITYFKFLKDVFICALGAYGGPEAHYGIFFDHMVRKKGYLSEEDLTELIALTTILPGPSSSQTIAAIGYKFGGVTLAILTMLVWALPGIGLMIGLSFIGQISGLLSLSPEIFRYIGPMAVAFIMTAIYNIGRRVLISRLGLFLFLSATLISYFYKEPWISPFLLLLGGISSIAVSNKKNIYNKVRINPPWKYLFIFLILAVSLPILKSFISHIVLDIFESFYRYGYLVIGGGQVVVPLMYSDLVEVNHYMTNQDFLTGYGLVQGVPGPMFSFSAYAGSLASASLGTLGQILGGLAAGLAIFLPGILLIFFIYPIWEEMKNIKAIKIAISGIGPVACGLILASAVSMVQKSGLGTDNILIMTVTLILLLTKKIPVPFIVLGTVLTGTFL